MSESITHTAVVDDALRFVVRYDEFCPEFRQAASEQVDLARLGGITRHGDKHTPLLLEKARTVFSDGKGGDAELAKLGFVIGWMSHRATDRQFKRIFRELDPDCPESPTDCSVYHDACLFRIVYNSGGKAPFDPASLRIGMRGHKASDVVNVEQVEELFRGMWRRMLIEMHTFIPDDDDIDTWLARVAATNQRLYVDLRRYADAYADTSSDKFKRFIVGCNFYNPDDPILVLMQALRNGNEPQSDRGIDDLTKADDTQSQYAQSLARAVRYIRAANEYFQFQIEKENLVDRLDIGKPELDKVD